MSTIGLVSVGLLAVASAGRGSTGDLSLLARQSIFAAGGLVSMTVFGLLGYQRLKPWVWLAVAGVIGSLILVLTSFGTNVRGTQGWFNVGGVSLQPSESAKIGLILAFAALFSSASQSSPAITADHQLIKLSRKQKRLIDEQAAIVFAKSLLVVGTFCLLVLRQGETGTVLVYGAIAAGMYFVAGLAFKYAALLVSTSLSAIYAAVGSGLLSATQLDRFRSFIDAGYDPLGAGYHQNQALTAIGSGSLMGAGLFSGPQTQLGYLPDQHTDFIFSAIAEETGLLGATVVVVLFVAVLGFVWRIGSDARDPFGKLVCVGVFSMFSFQIIQNIGMNLRLLPVTGIPLPLVSYGGSSMTTFLIALGLVQSVHLQRSRSRHN